MALKSQKKKNPNNLQLRSEVNILRKDLLNLRFKKTTGQLEKSSEIKKTRKKIARSLTRINKEKVSQNV